MSDLGALPPIRTKPQLIACLDEAMVMAHRSLCRFLYAAFSLKRSSDATCTAAEHAHVERWASTLYAVAREEIEHVSIAASLITALDGAPSFAHEGPIVVHRFDAGSARQLCALASPGAVRPLLDLYDAIDDGLRHLGGALELAGPAWSAWSPRSRRVADDRGDIYGVPITDLDTARAGVARMRASCDAGPAGRFRRLWEMVADLDALRADRSGFEPAYAVPETGATGAYTASSARAARDAFHCGHVTLLLMITGHHAHQRTPQWGSHPHLVRGFEDSGFAPRMTALLRTVGEVLPGLPGRPMAPWAGADFSLTRDDRVLLAQAGDPSDVGVNFYLGRMAELIGRLEQVLQSGPLADDVMGRVEAALACAVRVSQDLGYLYQKATIARAWGPADTAAVTDTCDSR